jgi:UDP-N-acetyl-D-galactosamine dehydrogenase
MKRKIALIGLGYVGLPIASAFGKKHPVLGFDISHRRIDELAKGWDRNLEVSEDDLKNSNLKFSADAKSLREADFYIVTVPTPIDEAKRPDLSPLKSASEMLGPNLKRGDIVVYESTVYPGATEEFCVPLLERTSGLKCGVDFKVGYSPERINPGDKEHSFTRIRKVVSAQDADSLAIVSSVYGSVVDAGIFEAASIRVAEAAKVIENTQRDLNIALMNELSLLFAKMGIDTHSVLEAAQTKWNFLPFRPGLVGGHCIGVDPYYLTFKAESIGYHPEVILAGRRINDSMAEHVANLTIRALVKKGLPVRDESVNIFGVTFKENCPDSRNSKVADVVRSLENASAKVHVHDPLAYADEVEHEYGIRLQPLSELRPANALVIAVAHDAFRRLKTGDLKSWVRPGGVVVDVKGILNVREVEGAGYSYARL